jgi:D-alanyl-D-alanine carboxypeptidase/D-alanyl-D-alanine-endopeptidase (penicillin-binding protein 4)
VTVYGSPRGLLRRLLARLGPNPARRRPVVVGLGSLVVLVLLADVGALVLRPGAPGVRLVARSGSADGETGSSLEPGLVLPAVTGGALPSGTGLATALAGKLADERLGDGVAVSVVDAASGRALYRSGADGMWTSASTAKLATATAVLETRGPAYRMRTVAVAGPRPGDVVLVGGGDPTLTVGPNGTYPGAGRLDQLAAQVRTALHGVAPARVLVDASLFTGSGTGPGWDGDVASGGSGAPATALMVDGGRTSPRYDNDRSTQPDLTAGAKFAQLLGLPASSVARGTAAHGARQLGAVLSPPVRDLVELMLKHSDNVIAEALARQVALAAGAPASFAGAAGAVRAALVRLGLPAGQLDLHDGSGLSRQDRLSAAVLTALLSLACRPDRPELWPVRTGLPVAGYDGTLAQRYRTGPAATAAGLLRAKTGTLSGVDTEAGLVVDADGRLLAFALMAEGTTDPEAVEAALDQAAAVLAGCGCR